MTIQELFIRSNEELRLVILNIKDEQWELNMPEGSSLQPATLGDAVRYHTYDDAWMSDVLAGKTKEEVGDMYDHLLEAEQHIKDNYVHYCQLAIDAVAEFDDLGKAVHLSYGDFSAGEYLQHVTAFRVFRIFDIAKLTGNEVNLDDEYVQALIDEFEPLMEMFRQVGVFGPAIDVAEDADLQTKLLAMAGKS